MPRSVGGEYRGGSMRASSVRSSERLFTWVLLRATGGAGRGRRTRTAAIAITTAAAAASDGHTQLIRLSRTGGPELVATPRSSSAERTACSALTRSRQRGHEK